MSVLIAIINRTLLLILQLGCKYLLMQRTCLSGPINDQLELKVSFIHDFYDIE